MSNSSHRNKEYETYHHLVSRIAHKVFFLEEDERNEFVDRMRRVAVFTGLKLLGWCIMRNHFHILAYLPAAEVVDEAEVLRRFGVLKGEAALGALSEQFSMWRALPGGDDLVEKELDRIRSRMYSVASFMKILKQWATEDYNKRRSHTGTLWESTYRDRVVGDSLHDKATVLSYILLNPIRAAVCSGFDEYPWSSATAFRKGDEVAIDGLRSIYGDGMSNEEMAADMHQRMDNALEECKRKWALKVARLRMAGYSEPPDPLTDEAMVAQMAAHLEKVQEAGMVLDEERRGLKRGPKRDASLEMIVLESLKANPHESVDELSVKLKKSSRTVARILSDLKSRGLISQAHRGAPYIVN